MEEDVAAAPAPATKEDVTEETAPAKKAEATPKRPDILAPDAADEEYEASDVFAWANNLYQYKDQLEIELFLINKNNVMYRTKLAAELDKQIQPLFIDGILDYVLTGAGEGLIVRSFEEAEAEENVLQRTRWKNVENLAEVMHWIRHQEEEMELFIDQEHDLKRMKGIMARCTHPSVPTPFYIIKQLPRAQMLKGDGAWMAMGKVFVPFDAGAALKIPSDNQLLIIDQDLYVFSQPKLRSLFGYDAKKNSIAAQKVAAIQEKFKLVFDGEQDLQSLVKGNKALINKLQKLELSEDIRQDKVIDHAEELEVDLLTDSSGAIIIEDAKDLARFVNLINDDYVESNLTGLRYEIRSKRPLKPTESDER